MSFADRLLAEDREPAEPRRQDDWATQQPSPCAGDEALMRQVLEATEIGRDLAQSVVIEQKCHQLRTGARFCAGAQSRLEQIDAAITALRARLEGVAPKTLSAEPAKEPT
jgi:hypothetical protein